MLIATMILVFQLVVSDGLIQDQGRSAQVAQAQSQKPQAAGPAARSGRGQRARSQSTPGELRVFHFKHIQCYRAANMVREVLDIHHVHSDLQTNSMIFAGSKAQAAKIEELLAILDTPASADAILGGGTLGESELRIVPVRNRNARDLANEIQHTLGSGSHLKVVADRARSAILLDGAKGILLKAESIIRELDTPAATAQLEFSFFKARLNGDGATPRIPEDLQAVAEELRRFGQVELLGRLLTTATKNEEFHIEGNIADMFSAEVGGVLLSVGEDGSVKIELDTEMSLRDPVSESKQRGATPHFALKTVIQARRGEFIVLGSAPSGWKSGESAILVLHVPR